MELAAAGLFRAKWTNKIHDEWIGGVLRNRSDLTIHQLSRTRELMNACVPDCLIEDYENLIEAVALPEPGDRHVLAAAIKGNCAAVITFNLRHFPASALEKYDIEAQHPDEFINHQFGLNHAGVVMAAQRWEEAKESTGLRRGLFANPQQTIAPEDRFRVGSLRSHHLGPVLTNRGRSAIAD
jgi:hypothetical protein